MVAATLLFHAREDKPFWWAHFDRLRLPVGEWMSDPGVFVIEDSEVVEDWRRDTPRQRPRRTVVVKGEPMGGVLLGPGSEISAVYACPPPLGVEVLAGHLNAKSSASVRVLEADDVVAPNGHIHQVLTLEELMPKDGDEHDCVPVALVPAGIVRTTNIDAALERLARRVQASLPELPASAGVDVLLRRPPRLRSGGTLPEVGEGDDRYVRAIEAALLDLDRSALSVQGPPGTGKTYVASQVIAHLVRDHGWRVGVCAQSHAAIENVLAAVVAAGVDPDQVAKNDQGAGRPAVDRPGTRPTTSPGSPRSRRAATSSAAPPGTSPTPSGSRPGSSTSSSSTRRASTPSPRPWRWPRPPTGSCCSATRSSCPRSRRARTPSPSTPRRWAG